MVHSELCALVYTLQLGHIVAHHRHVVVELTHELYAETAIVLFALRLLDGQRIDAVIHRIIDNLAGSCPELATVGVHVDELGFRQLLSLRHILNVVTHNVPAIERDGGDILQVARVLIV